MYLHRRPRDANLRDNYSTTAIRSSRARRAIGPPSEPGDSQNRGVCPSRR
jgi:hypothetical protein